MARASQLFRGLSSHVGISITRHCCNLLFFDQITPCDRFLHAPRTYPYYNFCLPHTSLRLPLPHPEPTNGTGSAKTWRPRTPAMTAGLTDHVWTLREVLLFRVPPWPQPVRM